MAEDIQTTDQPVNAGDDVATAKVEKTFTQDEVNGFLAKESKKAQEKIFKSLGFEDFGSAKEGLEQLKAWQDAQKSEAEKQAELLTQKDTELAQALADKKSLEAKLSALSAGVRADSLDDVIALAERLVTDEVAIDTAIKQVLDKYPQFGQVATTETDPLPTFVVGGNPNAQGSPAVTKEQFGKMTYPERVALKAENPALFEELTKGD